RPSGSQAVHSGSDTTCATTSLWPARSTATTSPADQSEKYSRSPCQRGDSTRPRPVSSVRTSAILVTALPRGRPSASRPTYLGTTADQIDGPSPALRVWQRIDDGRRIRRRNYADTPGRCLLTHGL